VAELGNLLRDYADFELGRTPVSEVVVFSSQLDRSGPTYEALARARLGGAEV
jgi:2'-5' RNA ligase